MIQKLINQVIALLQGALAAEIPAGRIIVGPISEPAEGDRPTLALYQDRFTIGSKFRETASSSPRPQDFREAMALDAVPPEGPYALSKTPLTQSLQCKLVFSEGTQTERAFLLQEGKDFIIDYTWSTLTFTADVEHDLTQADSMRLAYAFVGVFTVREFQQDFLLDVYDDTAADVERWASLAVAMILTNHDELLEQYNATDVTAYGIGPYLNTHTIDHLHLEEGVPDYSGGAARMQYRFQVHGQIRPVRELAGGFSLIEKIRSPGRPPGGPDPVDLEIDLE